MNPFYKEPVIVFGGVAPLVAVVVAFVVLFNYKGKLETEHRMKQRSYEEVQKVVRERQRLEAKVDEQAPYLNSWMSLFEKPTATSVNGFLGAVQKKFGGEEFQQTAFRRSSSSSGIGSASAQPSIQIQLAFRGTYSALQNAFVELETSMPQLQLDSIKITPNANRKVLNADLVYTAWQTE
ncbi:MAG: hypothetical protein HKN82_06715 [Akkermansiaceae bacterium]|nr:hypothetical protein [Akkermansiaceae bacterium]NNM28406.1 hypothetical protein [Akkermansiaceae bacterium]